MKLYDAHTHAFILCVLLWSSTGDTPRNVLSVLYRVPSLVPALVPYYDSSYLYVRLLGVQERLVPLVVELALLPIESLAHEPTITDVQYAVRVQLKVRVVRHHDQCLFRLLVHL